MHNCGVKAQSQNRARAHELSDKYQSKAVHWAGRVSGSVNEQTKRDYAKDREQITGHQVRVEMQPSDATASGFDLLLEMPTRCKGDGVLNLVDGGPVEFIGVIRKLGDSVLHRKVGFLSLKSPRPASRSAQPAEIEQIIEFEGRSFPNYRCHLVAGRSRMRTNCAKH